MLTGWRFRCSPTQSPIGPRGFCNLVILMHRLFDHLTCATQHSGGGGVCVCGGVGGGGGLKRRRCVVEICTKSKFVGIPVVAAITVFMQWNRQRVRLLFAPVNTECPRDKAQAHLHLATLQRGSRRWRHSSKRLPAGWGWWEGGMWMWISERLVQ